MLPLRVIKVAINVCSVNRACDRAWLLALIKLHFRAAFLMRNKEQFVAFQSPLLYRQYINIALICPYRNESIVKESRFSKEVHEWSCFNILGESLVFIGCSLYGTRVSIITVR